MDTFGRMWEGDSVLLATKEDGLITDARGISRPVDGAVACAVGRPCWTTLILRIVLAEAYAGNDRGIPGLKGETWGTAAFLRPGLLESDLLERDYDFSSGVTFLRVRQSGGCFSQRVLSVDRRSKFAGFDQFGESGQVVFLYFRHEECEFLPRQQ
jgi:hypothetical protein